LRGTRFTIFKQQLQQPKINFGGTKKNTLGKGGAGCV